MAYMTADHERWQQLDFVLGQHVLLSNNHTLNGKPFYDICDELSGKDEKDRRGRYPKGFKFTGWHPLCRCHVVPLMLTNEEMREMTQAIIKGEKYTPESKSITEMPPEFKQWMEDNADRIERARRRGTLPYFVREWQRMNEYAGRSIFSNKQDKTSAVIRHGSSQFDISEQENKARRKIALELYSNQQSLRLSTSQQENIRRVAKVMGIDVGSPMLFEQADNGRSNLMYQLGKGYESNCQSCVVVHEARLRGLNITTNPFIEDGSSTPYLLGEKFQVAWINPKTGKMPTPNVLESKDDAQNQSFILKATESKGRYHIAFDGVNKKGRVYGHIVTAERLEDGQFVIYDPQNNTFLDIADFKNITKMEMIKVSNLVFKEQVVKAISKSIK